MTTATRIHVAQGQVAAHQGTRFGGISHVPATSNAPAQVRIAVRYDTCELTAQLQEGDALNVPGQTWRLDAIDATSCRWYATLARAG